MLDRTLQKVQEWRFGNFGLSLAFAATLFTMTATGIQLAGVPGSVVTLFAAVYPSSLAFFIAYLYLVTRHYQRDLRERRKLGLGGRSLTTQRSRTIGVVAPISYWSTEYYIEIVRGIRAAAERERADLRRHLVILDVPQEEFSEVQETMTDSIIQQVSGLIVINMQLNDMMRRQLLEADMSVVNIAHEDNQSPCVTNIVPDHTGFEELLGQVLIQQKCAASVLVMKSLANPFKGGQPDPYRKEKRELYVRAAGKAGLTVLNPIRLEDLAGKLDLHPGVALIIDVDQYVAEDGLALFRRLPPSTPPNTGFIFLADVTAIGFLLACSRDGLTAKERKFRVAGYDNTKAAEWFDLTSVDQQLNIAGRLAYEKLQLALDHPDHISYATDKVRTVCVIRGSTNW